MMTGRGGRTVGAGTEHVLTPYAPVQLGADTVEGGMKRATRADCCPVRSRLSSGATGTGAVFTDDSPPLSVMADDATRTPPSGKPESDRGAEDGGGGT